MEQRDEGYLPPEPSGPEPDVGGGQVPCGRAGAAAGGVGASGG